MEYSFNNHDLILDGSIIYSFEVGINEIASFDNCVVAVLNRDDYNREDVMRSRNVMCVDSSGMLLWQIPELESDKNNSPYVGLFKEGSNVKLVKFDGTFAIVEPKTGNVLTTPLESMKGRKIW